MMANRVYDQALRLLARRSHGEQELAGKLIAKGADPEIVREVIDRCRELGYLDDKTMAEEFARYRLHSCQHGPWRIKADLRARGLSEEAIKEAINASTADTDLVELAQNALSHRFGAALLPEGDRDEARKALRRQYDFLARRGFSSDIIQRALNRDFAD